MNKKGFTLIELIIAIMIFAIISLISYKIIIALITTKEVVKNSQGKLGSVAQVINKINDTMENSIPLVIRDENGVLQPAIYGKNKIENNYDSQIEVTVSGSIGDLIYGSNPPRRVGFRFYNNKLFLVSWPVLNRVITTVPRLDVLLDNVKNFKMEYYYIDRQWRDTWPLDIKSYNILPLGFKLTIELFTGEVIYKQWAIS